MRELGIAPLLFRIGRADNSFRDYLDFPSRPVAIRGIIEARGKQFFRKLPLYGWPPAGSSMICHMDGAGNR